jgi:hypothetical protein
MLGGFDMKIDPILVGKEGELYDFLIFHLGYEPKDAMRILKTRSHLGLSKLKLPVGTKFKKLDEKKLLDYLVKHSRQINSKEELAMREGLVSDLFNTPNIMKKRKRR